MKKLFVIILCVFLGLSVQAQTKKGYEISITIKGSPIKKYYLGYYFGDKQYLRDSGYTDASGKIVFKGKEPLEGGIYLIATFDKALLFDFVVTEQHFALETDTANIIGNMKVKGSIENDIFFNYSKYTTGIGKNAMALDAKIKEAEEKKDAKLAEKLKEEYKTLTQGLQEYRTKLMQENPKVLLSKVFKMMTDIDVPDAPKNEKGEIIDSNFQYNYYYNHYFDNFDFSDDRIVRTPVFHNKFETFILKLTPQIPDSIIRSADFVLKKAEGTKENLKYMMYWITNHYETSQFMGMDKIFVHMIDNYYAKGKAYWVDETLLFKMKDRADQLRNNLIGIKGQNLTMLDTSHVYHSLYNLKGKYTLLIFYDATCHRCKEEMPKLKELYDELNVSVKKDNYFDVFSVSLTADPKEWVKYLQEMKFKWLNVYDPNNETNFRKLYDVYSTPVLYLLSKDKKIIAKRLTVEQIKDFIKDYEKRPMY